MLHVAGGPLPNPLPEGEGVLHVAGGPLPNPLPKGEGVYTWPATPHL